jgi:colanic acid/amylovoran biosynthesis glycosyltransferase
MSATPRIVPQNLEEAPCMKDGPPATSPIVLGSTDFIVDETASRPVVAVYADPLLAPTMTFVRAQGLAMKSFSALFVGARRVRPGLDLPDDQVLVLRDRATRLARLREVPLKVFGYAPLFFRRVQQFSPVLLHAHFGPAALTALPIARWLDIPLIATFHGYDATENEASLRRANYRAAVYTLRKAKLQRGARRFIAVSEFIRNCIVEQGFSADRTIVHYIGIDLDAFRPDLTRRREAVVLFVATLTEKKGCEYLIRAMQEVQVAEPRAELVVIGDGALRTKLERMSSSLRNVRFLGIQPSAVVKDWMNRAKVFCVPSIRAQSGDAEGFGMVFAEAQAMGLPVASFSSGGIPEAVEHGVTGLLAPEKDWQGLAANICLLLRDDAMWEQMSGAGRARVAERFDLRKQTAKLEELYREVVMESKPC